jgi:tetratricopeptide (TPR) repeat protein
MHEEAIAEAQKAKALSENPWYTAHLAYIYAIAGNNDEAEQMLDEMMKLSNQELIQHASSMALIYIGSKNYDQAFIWLETAYQQRDYWLVTAKGAPEFDPVRSDSRFKELLIKMGLENE